MANQNKNHWKSQLSKYKVFSNTKPEVYEYVSTNKFDGVTFMMTNACNLACRYCYASDYQKKPSFMPEDIWSKTLEYAFENRDMKSNEFSLAFHGFGECTLFFKDIIKISEAFKRKAKTLGLKPIFQITTNGTFTESECTYLIENNYRVNLSIDGDKEINDSMRLQKNGKSPFEKIVSNAKMLSNAVTKERLLARSTVTSKSLDKMIESLEYFNSIGIRMVHFAPMDIRGAATGIDKLAVDINEFIEKLKECIHKASELGMKIYYGPFNFGIGTRFCFSKSKLTVDYSGRIIACVEAGENSDYEEFCFGNIREQQIGFKQDRIDKLNSISVYDYPECNNCLLKYHCAGYCRVNRIQREKNNSEFAHICKANENGFAWILNELTLNKDRVKSLLDFPVEQLL